MIAKGTTLKLRESPTVYTVGDFKIDSPEPGLSEKPLLELIDQSGDSRWFPVWMIVDLRELLELYTPEEEELFAKLREIRAKRKAA